MPDEIPNPTISMEVGKFYVHAYQIDSAGVKSLADIEIPAPQAAVAYPIAVAKGGTGATDAAQARVNLGVPPATPPYVPPSTYPKDFGPYRNEDTNPTGVIRFIMNGRMFDMVVTDKGAAPVTE